MSYLFFFFKQETAYEMRSSDWSSDVCSSDLVKDLGTRYPTMQVMFFRSIFAFVPILLVVLHSRSLQALRMHSPIGHLLRSLVGVVAMFCFFYAYSRMPLAEAVAIGFAAPVFVVALSVDRKSKRLNSSH